MSGFFKWNSSPRFKNHYAILYSFLWILQVIWSKEGGPLDDLVVPSGLKLYKNITHVWVSAYLSILRERLHNIVENSITTLSWSLMLFMEEEARVPCLNQSRVAAECGNVGLDCCAVTR